jgi:tetratricopeptide (TPR) repeat protein
MVEYFRNVFAEQVRADNLMGPHHLVDVVRAQALLLDQVLPNARGPARRELLRLAFGYNEFAGWLYQDASDATNAMHYSDRAMDFALEIDQPRETAYLLMRKANITIDQGRPDRALALTNAALREPRKVPPRVQALILGQQARAHAHLGSPGEAARAIDKAYQAVCRPDDDSNDLAAYCSPSYVAMEAATCWNRLGRYDVATTTYKLSLRNWSDEYRRDRGLCLARLATAYAGQENVEQACETGRRAVEVVELATSGRALDELERVRLKLAPWRRDAEVSDLLQTIRRLVQPAA